MLVLQGHCPLVFQYFTENGKSQPLTPSGLEGVIDCLRNWRLDRRWGSDSVNEVESASDDFLQRRGNDGGDQEGKEEEEEDKVHPHMTSTV